MHDEEVIRHALAAANIEGDVAEIRDLSGGCIHRVKRISLRNGSSIVAKMNRASHLAMFQQEANGLRAIAASNTVLVPKPIAALTIENTAILLMNAIDVEIGDASTAAWRWFGEELAAMHQCDVGQRYGFVTNNYIGSTPQPNRWMDDWVEFNRINRLGFQLSMAIEHQRLNSPEARAVEVVIEQLDSFIPHKPKPALLHGDLWAGNALPAAGDRIAVIDPACSIGDGWADIAMMQLFGGFPRTCFDAYAANVSDHDAIEHRIAVYQLYHLLNHVNLFGRGYASQAVGVASRLTG